MIRVTSDGERWQFERKEEPRLYIVERITSLEDDPPLPMMAFVSTDVVESDSACVRVTCVHRLLSPDGSVEYELKRKGPK